MTASGGTSAGVEPSIGIQYQSWLIFFIFTVAMLVTGNFYLKCRTYTTSITSPLIQTQVAMLFSYVWLYVTIFNLMTKITLHGSAQ